MSVIIDILYNFFIMPIQILIYIIFTSMNRVLGNSGGAVIAVSLVVQTLVLPLYERADALQEEERRQQEKMAHWVEHIKKTFKGEERFMMLSYYYKKMDYKPWYALKSSVSVLLQIPFFIAAYRYLSATPLLAGQSFLFIKDLGKPDSIVTLGGFAVNIMPILMTVLNILSCEVYTRGMSFKDKIQPYALALFFLVLLYNSPSGLVLYWTVNQLYSLLKNIVEKNLKNKSGDIFGQTEKTQSQIGTYLTIAAFFALFTGGVIPLNIVHSSVMEFAETGNNPIHILLLVLSLWVGALVFWGGIFYSLFSDELRKMMIITVACISIGGVVNYLFWGNDSGVMSTLLTYEFAPYYTLPENLVNLCIYLAVICPVAYITIKRMDWAKMVFRVLMLSVVLFCAVRFVSIAGQLVDYYENKNATVEEGDKILSLSKNGRNVVFIMLDRAIGGYVPFMFEEKPELKEAFAGFTWYSNTISHGCYTNFGVPELYGGYEYTPEEMNRRSDELMSDKHNEALLVLPRLFSQNGYDVTVCDPPYAGYEWTPDLTIYDGYDGIKSYITKGAFVEKSGAISPQFYKAKQEHAFFFHCVMRISPLFFQPYYYMAVDGATMYGDELPSEYGSFLSDYSTLLCLEDMTQIKEDGGDSFIQLQNETTHHSAILKKPEYMPDLKLTDEMVQGYMDDESNVRTLNGVTLTMGDKQGLGHYHDNMAALMALAHWFDYLKENECWDNTRIIVSADHGRGMGQFDNMTLQDELDVEWVNPLLLVKDFGDSQYRESDEFMTIADVPSLLTEGVIDDPVNPFTGNAINTEAKNDVQMVTMSQNWMIFPGSGTAFDTSDAPWFELTPGDIFSEENWKMVD